MQFEFGDTSESRAFLARNPKYLASFANLMALSNKVFGREIRPKSRIEEIGFWLGHGCRADFTELTFLSLNGYADAAMKILRGLYERARQPCLLD